MEYFPVRLRTLMPPKDDLGVALDEVELPLKSGDIIVLSSKVVAIHEGNCVPVGEVDKKQLVAEEAEVSIERTYWPSPLTIKHNAFIGNAGVDESNGDGYYITLPDNPFVSAKEWYEYFVKRSGRKDIGVVIVDSHSTPLRRGALGIAIGWWGFEPTVSHVGKPDLFGRPFKVEVTNIVDAIAAGATLAMGETNESTPLVVVRDTPNLTFTETLTKDELFVKPEQDTFRVLYDRFLT